MERSIEVRVGLGPALTSGLHSREHPTLSILHWLLVRQKLCQDLARAGPGQRAHPTGVVTRPVAHQDTIVVLYVDPG